MSYHEDELGFTKTFEDRLRQAVDDCVGIINNDSHLSSKVRLVSLAPFDTARNQNAQPIVKYVGDLGKELEKAREGLGYSEKEIEKNAKKLFSTFLRSMPQSFVKGQIFLFEPNATLIACSCDKSKKKPYKEKTYRAKDLAVLGGKFGVDYTESDIDEMVRYQVQTLGAHDVGFHLPVLFADDAELTSADYYWAGEKSTLLYTLVSVVASPRDHDEVVDIAIKLRDSLARLSYLLFQRVTFVFGHKLQVANIHSAIGSIMSRNGSHNIGSHVLAALSHNVGTMPDDRVLYQYIQQRMDYIANVTTESPSWTQPTMLVGDLIRTFLSQRHLLDHIAESEGLSAWEFQNRNTVYDDAQAGKIKIHVRKVKWNSCAVEVLHDFIKYASNEVDKKIDLSQDVALAIPGGVAGQHAFFTIIENVIRNAAKHDWSNPPQRTKHIKDENGNLEVYIDFEDKEDEGKVEFNIWTNMSDVLEDPGAGNNVESDKALHKLLAAKLKMSFIDDNSGALRRANWGLAEMKISAGYLQGRKSSEIGGIDKSFDAKSIIDPQYIEDNDVKHLVYRFCVPKPKMMLFLLNGEKDDEKELLAEWKKHESEFKRHGIYAKTYAEVLDEAERDKLAFPKLDYEYVVIDYMGEDEANWFLPFRVMTIKPTEVKGAKNIVPHIKDWESCADILKSMLSSDQKNFNLGNLKDTVDKILACWCKFMKSRHMKIGDEPLNLVLTVKEDNANSSSSSGAGKGLISKGDVVRFVFEEMLHSVIDSFRKLNQLGDKVDGKIIAALDKLLARRSRMTKPEKICGDEYRICINGWLQALLADDSDATIVVKRKELNKRIIEIESKGDIASDEEKEEALRLDRQLRSLTNIPVPEECTILKPFAGYMERVCVQMETVLCKYAENIVSLPKGFASDDNVSCDCKCEEWKDAAVHFWKGARKVGADKALFDWRELSDGLFDESKNIKDNASIEFIRHYNPNTEKMREKCLYAEPLSGSQSYLNILERCTSADKRTIARLVETASLRILVIDERVAKFYREHANEIARTFRSMHIYVADDKKVDEELQLIQNSLNNDPPKYDAQLEQLRKETSNEGLISFSVQNIVEGRKTIDSADESPVKWHGDERIENFTKEKFFDVLIIHQGIIDKWFPGTANDSKRVEKLLKYLQQFFPYVVITTGRGSPANIPDMARMIPFSTIETTLFKKYPEKMVLVDAVMNVLPKGATENG